MYIAMHIGMHVRSCISCTHQFYSNDICHCLFDILCMIYIHNVGMYCAQRCTYRENFEALSILIYIRNHFRKFLDGDIQDTNSMNTIKFGHQINNVKVPHLVSCTAWA